jgi:hypothetical protein
VLGMGLDSTSAVMLTDKKIEELISLAGADTLVGHDGSHLLLADYPCAIPSCPLPSLPTPMPALKMTTVLPRHGSQ